MRSMAKSLGNFRAALLIGWVVLGSAGILYARWRGIPSWAALPVLAAFLIEYPFYLVPAFPSVRERISGIGIPLFAIAAIVSPYLVCGLGAVHFEWFGLLKLIACGLVMGLWFRILPPSRITDVLFLAAFAGFLIGGPKDYRFFNTIFAPLHPEFKDLKNVIVIPHLALISMTVMALMLQRSVPETGFGFVPDRRELRIGLLHFLYFLPIGLPMALLLGATKLADTSKPLWYIVGTFIGMFCVASLSEEFLLRGVLQPWFEDWFRSRTGALLLTSAIFGLLHLWLGKFPNWKWALVASVLGWFCGRARNQAGSIRASMVTHALVATAWRAFFV